MTFGAIVFVLFHRDRLAALPRELGCSPSTAHRRLQGWARAGVWARLHRELLRRLNAAGRIDWSTAVIDGCYIRALFGGLHTGPSPVDRARSGSKHHLVTDALGVPLAVSVTGANRNDVTQLLPLIDGIAGVTGNVGRPRQRAARLIADRGYDHDKYRRALRERGVKPMIPRRGSDHGSWLGTERWVVERTLAWLHNVRSRRTRCERLPELRLAFLRLGCTVVCQRMLAWG